MAASKKAQEDKNLKVLRELASLPANRQCMDCNQRGPTYVNTTIWSFVCTSCSGRLRGLNPPHRVKSISMTTFSQDEIEQLRKGGNEVAKAKWLALWNDRTDRMPDAKDDQAVMDFMREKYEKKRWFNVRDQTPKQEETPRRPSLGKPPQKEKKTPPSGGVVTVRQRPLISPTTEDKADSKQQQRQQQQQQQQSLVNTSVNSDDPFSAAPPTNPAKSVKPPVGGVAVLPGVAAVLKPQPHKSPSSDSFGAFASASAASPDGLLTPAGTQNANSPRNTSLSPAVSTGQLSASHLGSGGGDKYSALADLDSQIKDLRVSPTPPTQDPASGPAANPFGNTAPPQNGAQVGGGSMWGGQGGVAQSGSGFSMPNPFGAASNPFQSGAPGPMMQGGVNQSAPGNWGSAQYGAAQQPFGGVGMQPQIGTGASGVSGFHANTPPQGYMGVGVSQAGQFGVQGQWSAGFPQQGSIVSQQQQQPFPPFGQVGGTQLGYPQQQQMQSFVAPQGQFGGSGVPQGQFGGSGVPQGQFGGSGVPQGQFGGSGVPQGQFGGSGVSQGQFGGSGVPQGQFGGSGVPQGQFGGSGAPQGQFGGSGVPQAQFGGSRVPQGQFGGSGVPQGQAGIGNFQWGQTQQPSSFATSGSPKVSSAQPPTSATANTVSMDWSANMTKPIPSTSASTSVSVSLGGWSENILAGYRSGGSTSISNVSGSTQGPSGVSVWAGQSGTQSSGWAGQSAAQSSGWGAGMSAGTPGSGWGPSGGSASQLTQPTMPSFTNQQNWAAGGGGNSTVGMHQPTGFGASTPDFASWPGSSTPSATAGNPFGQQQAPSKSTNPFL